MGQAVDLTYQPPSFSTSDAPAYSASGSQKPTDDAEMDEVDRALRELGLDPASGVNYDGDYEDQDLLDQKSIWNTLLELYLTSSGAAVNAAKGRDTALKLLQQHESLPYDIPHAVMLCAVEAFNEGLILLYERMGMFEDVVRLHMDSASSSSSSSSSDDDQSGEESSRRVVESLHKYGPIQPELYDLVLRFLISSPILLSRHTSDLLSILTTIRETSLMSTLEIIQLLSSTPYTHVGIIRDFLSSSIATVLSSTATDSSAIADYKLSTDETLTEIAELTNADGARVFQMTRCTACSGQLDLPSVHFMCKHSYHQRCLGEEEGECPSCADHQGRVRAMRGKMAREAMEVVEAAKGEAGESEGGVRGVIGRAASGQGGEGGGDGFADLARLFSNPIMSNAYAAQML